MTNYFRVIEVSSWPRRNIADVREVKNIYDDYGIAVEVELDCGHKYIMTGEAGFRFRKYIHCKLCGESNDG